MHIIVVEPDDNKTIIGIGRIGADMRSAKDALYWSDRPP